MEAKELRIGNLIEANGKIIDIGMIKPNFISWNISLNPKNKIWNPFLPINDNRLKPIPLTHDLLLKFGFKYDDNWHYTIGENPLTMDYLLDITWIEGDKYPFYRNGHFKIKYVHQLQNLFFSLTGEELTVSS